MQLKRSVCLFMIAIEITRGSAVFAGDPVYPKGNAAPDSYRYYGPNSLWESWTKDQKHGRDTWIHWTGGNQKFLRWGAETAGGGKVPISLDFYRLLDSRNRNERFRQFGLINEPNCVASTEPDEYGLYFDKWIGDGYRREAAGKPGYENVDYDKGRYPYYPDPEAYPEYGAPTGVAGLRKFKNPMFDRSKWDAQAYFTNPGKIQPPYLIGFSCAFCHISFNPNNPPADPANPRWENLAANLGNQYFREGDIFFARGRMLFGDRGATDPKDPYKTTGLSPKSLLFHYAVTQQPGTSETSRISYDFINNPTIINSIMNLGSRPRFVEKDPDGKMRVVNHVLADGADSVGLSFALLRVWINIGCEGYYWKDTLYNPATGERQRPLNFDELLMNDRVSPERKKELESTYSTYLKERYGHGLGEDWKEAWRRNPSLASYLTSYGGFSLNVALKGLEDQANSLDGEAKAKRLAEIAKLRPNSEAVERGKKIFAKNCVECHSSKLPEYPNDANAAEHRKYLEESVLKPDFLVGNTLSNDQRYSTARLKTNMGRAMATNAVDGDVWARFSSANYKALPPVGTVEFAYSVDDTGSLVPLKKKGDQGEIKVRYTPPGGGRGYYRSPTLVSTWATAPYLHNNSVGDYQVVQRDAKRAVIGRKMVPNNGTVLGDEIDVSVEGRLKMFQDGMEKLLSPGDRHNSILRTQQDCDLSDLLPVFKHALHGVLRDWLFEFVEHRLEVAVEDLAKEKKITSEQALALRKKLVAFKEELRTLEAKLSPDELKVVHERVGELIKTSLIMKAEEVVPKEAVEAVSARLQAVRAQLAQEVERLVARDFLRVPRGTPVNLYFNLPSEAVPYALKAHLLYADNPTMRMQTLLRLSNCPDLIEDHGHDFGSRLSEDDKRDLIEFIKTF